MFNRGVLLILSELFPLFIAQLDENLSDICLCDVVRKKCEVNCCCDKDCSDDDVTVFSKCVNKPQRSDRNLCSRTSALIFDNSGIESSFTNNHILCIYADNFEGRNYYSVPDSIQDLQEFTSLKSRSIIGSDSPQPISVASQQETFFFNSRYYSGDTIYRIDDRPKIMSDWSLPAGILSSACDSMQSVRYLIDFTSECMNSLQNISVTCETNPTLAASNYYNDFHLLKSTGALSPGFSAGLTLQENVASLLAPNLIKIQVPENIESNPKFDEDTGTCNFVVSKVEYNIIINSSEGIVKVNTKLTFLPAVTAEENSITQEFRVRFAWEGSTFPDGEPPLVRSGNPGYIVGKPVMAGVLIYKNGDPSTPIPNEGEVDIEQQINPAAIQVSVDPNDWLTLIDSMHCESANVRSSVLFGYSMSSGCLIRLNESLDATKCKRLQEEVWRALRGPKNLDRVAAFASASVSKHADWVPVLVSNEPNIDQVGSSGAGKCSSMVLGVTLQILYSQTGNILNPQAKIIGVMYNYDSPKDIKINCMGGVCYSSVTSSENVVVISRVEFIDVSASFEPSLSTIPTIDITLPNDFFYPFTGNLNSFAYSVKASVYHVFLSILVKFAF